jgi:hypothetical protein
VFKLTTMPAALDIYTTQFLPPQEQRMLKFK